MRFATTVTAERLGSVALRYRGVTVPRHVRVQRRCSWWFGLPTPGEGGEHGGDTVTARRQRVEAILLISREPLNSRKLSEHARLTDGTEARTLVRQLNRLYDDTGRAFRVEQVGGGFRLLTRRQFAPWLRRLVHVPPVERLSAPGLVTLAVVAYRQPVLRAEIEAIRGVSCGEILRQLMDRDLVRIGGRSDELGRPYLYTTTKRFLQLFGLQSLDELPRAFALRNDSRSTDQANGVVTAPMSTDDQPQEQEKSEVSLTLPTHQPVDEMFEEVSSLTAVGPRCGYDEDEFDDDFEEDEDEDEEEDDEVEEDDFEEDEIDDEDDLEDEEDDLEDEEWEEVEDDDDDLDEGWDDDEEWDEDDEEFDDEEEADVEELEEDEAEEGEEEEEEWE
jgi:segregation and condensation protein B